MWRKAKKTFLAEDWLTAQMRFGKFEALDIAQYHALITEIGPI